MVGTLALCPLYDPNSDFKQPASSLRRASAFPRRVSRPSSAKHTLETTEGAGNAGCEARTRSLVCEMERSTQAQSLQVKPEHRHSLRDGLRFICALSPVSGLFSPRRLRVIACKLDISVGISGP